MRAPPWPRVAMRGHGAWTWRPNPATLAECPTWRLRYAALRRADVSRGAHTTPLVCFEFASASPSTGAGNAASAGPPEEDAAPPLPPTQSTHNGARSSGSRQLAALSVANIANVLHSHAGTANGMQAVLPSVARALAVEDYACSPRFPDANSSPPSPQEAATLILIAPFNHQLFTIAADLVWYGCLVLLADPTAVSTRREDGVKT